MKVAFVFQHFKVLYVKQVYLQRKHLANENFLQSPGVQLLKNTLRRIPTTGVGLYSGYRKRCQNIIGHHRVMSLMKHQLEKPFSERFQLRTHWLMPQLCWMRKSSREAVTGRRAVRRMRTERGTYSRVLSRPWWSASWGVTWTTSIPRGPAPHTLRSHVPVTGCSAPFWTPHLILELFRRAGKLEDQVFLKRALVSPWRGLGAAWQQENSACGSAVPGPSPYAD